MLRAMSRRPDPRPFIYAGLDLVLAAGFVYSILFLSPNRHAWATALMAVIPVAVLAMGVGSLLRNRLGWRIAVAGGAVLLLATIVLLGFLLASAAFLSGVYGAFGTAAASGILGATFLMIELVALVPALQLKYLLTRAGRRAFGQPPLWSAR